MPTPPSSPTRLEIELQHQERWYARAIEQRFFDREGFRQLIAWNLRALREAVPMRPDMRVLSLGCGLGDYERALAGSVNRLVAVDLSSTAVAEAQRRAAADGVHNLEFRCAPIETLEFSPGSFDLVYAFGVLHHLSHDSRHELFHLAHAWLDVGGWLYCRDPNARGVLRRTASVALLGQTGFHSPVERELDPQDTVAEMRGAGFEETRVDYTDVLGCPLPWILATRAPLFWRTVFALDRVWLATPGLRRLASQFSVTARR